MSAANKKTCLKNKAGFFRLSIKAHLRCHSCGCLLAYVSTRCGAILVVPSIWTFLNSLWFSSEIVFVEFINKLKSRPLGRL